MSSLSLQKVIGSGSYGSVYHARWEGREVAIKQLFITASEAAMDESIKREIQLLETLRDERIIEIYGATSYEDRLVVVMEYADGGCLDEAIESRIFDWPDRFRLADEMAQGLAYIHAKGVLHCDLKSMNVLLTGRKQAKLCDFGFATIKAHAASVSTDLKGTFRWMAPEIFEARPTYSNKSDVYSLGMVLWEMAAGQTTPFEVYSDNFSVAKAVMRGEKETLPADTPSDYRRWVEQCWSFDPAKRPEASAMVGKIGKASLSVNTPTSSPGDEKAKGTVAALSAKADKGDVQAQLALAAMYEDGTDGVEQDYEEALKWYLRAAERQSPEGQRKTSEFFRMGRGTEQDYDVGLSWMRKAVDGGYAVAQREFGQMYLLGGDCVRESVVDAMVWLRKAADQGNAAAQNDIGVMYRLGRGVKQNYADSVSWFRKSAEQGDADGQYNLGWMYATGRGIERDYVQAASWFKKSAEQGNARAQGGLKVMYKQGKAVPKDVEQAARWFQRSDAVKVPS